jgi:hypothetical protein
MNNLSTLSGYQHPRCFARSLGNCSTTISGEHFISKSILDFLYPDNTMFLSGPKWLNGQDNKKIPISSFTANVLCKTHNSALSDLDAQMSKFVRFIYTIDEGQFESISINGYDIERWMLKTLCGFIVSGAGHKKYKGWTPPQSWLQILFSSSKVETGMGFYFLSSMSRRQERNNQIGFVPIKANDQGAITGLGFVITAHLFLFLMEPLSQEIKAGLPDYEPIYRPRIIEMNYVNSRKTIDFGWNTEDIVHIDIIHKIKNSLLYKKE